MTAALHAARQLTWHLQSSQPLPPPEWLTADEAALFVRMAPPDQFEGLAVADTLAAWGWGGDRELLLAAVLHDVGKRLAPAGAHYRVLMTVLETLLPWLVPAVTARSRALAALAHHAAAGGRMASDAGLPTDVVRLIADHHQPAVDARMVALQRADALH